MASQREKGKDKGKGGSPGSASAFMKPLQPDAVLAKIVGSDPIPRTEVTKKIWDYIRTNNLQDPSDKRKIRADKKLKIIFSGRDSISMFELTKAVNSHLYEYIGPSVQSGDITILGSFMPSEGEVLGYNGGGSLDGNDTTKDPDEG